MFNAPLLVYPLLHVFIILARNLCRFLLQDTSLVTSGTNSIEAAQKTVIRDHEHDKQVLAPCVYQG